MDARSGNFLQRKKIRKKQISTLIQMKQLLFNPNGSDAKQDRQIFKGNPTNLINLNNVKYDWAVQLWRGMRENFWLAEKIDLSLDVIQYNELTYEERRAYDGILAFLVFLDSEQTVNLPHLKCGYITAPEIRICLSEQEAQESLHSQAYSYQIETIIPQDRRQEIYDYWRKDKVLKRTVSINC